MSDTPQTQPVYQVLARKYRPATFDDLIGQEAMVRTLQNAFAADRIAHAFILTGVRGVGKTTTARIIAKGMNCTGVDGTGGPTTDPCGKCENCVSIAEGRHVDVLEMDAASRTGVNDIREIIDSVHYRAASARYKIYVIDEVHMLSISAFNALLKTLEEPPEHVKFIFATTEIRKIPVTVLSRCQRYDLRRIEAEEMIAHLTKIAGLEKADLSDDALGLIARAAEGSVRDALSLLDQAISHAHGEVGADQVRAMLGLADRGRVLDLFDMIMCGDAAGALAELSAQYAAGADPIAVLRDLAEVTHWVSVIKITPDASEDPTVSPDERTRGTDMAARLPMRSLSRMWQMLLKALEEVAQSPNAMMAAEMAMIRLTHVAELPPPEELIRRLEATPPPATGATPTSGRGRSARPTTPPPQTSQQMVASEPDDPGSTSMRTGTSEDISAINPSPAASLARYARFDDVIELIRANRDLGLLVDVENHMRLAKYEPGRFEFELTGNPTADFPTRLAARLQSWTGVRWGVSVVNQGGGQTIAEERNARNTDLRAQAIAHPMVAAVLAQFPNAEIVDIRTADTQADTDPFEPDEMDDNWDPFEDG